MRTDPHKPSTIIPAEYEYILSYNLHTTEEGWPMPSFGIHCGNEEHEPDGGCCVVGLQRARKFADHGGVGQCTSCGAAFIYGDVYYHRPSNEYIHLGWICADKMELFADRSEYYRERDKVWKAKKAQLQKEHNQKMREEYLNDYPELRTALLETDNPVSQDLYQKILSYHSLTDGQIKLAIKIFTEENQPVDKNAPVQISVPEGIENNRVNIEGEVVSIKEKETHYGVTLKMTVKVMDENGYWLTWGTVPSEIEDDVQKGDKVSFIARIQVTEERDFSFFKYPKKAEIKEKS